VFISENHGRVARATMMQFSNPFHPVTDPDRHDIWHRLILVDSEAFVAGDWSMIEGDFDAETFEGIRCGESSNPDDWKLAFATVAEYRDSWLVASREFMRKKFSDHSHLQAVMVRAHLDQIDIVGDRALAHKKFFGDIPQADGTFLSGSRQTIYRLHKRHNSWKIVGFLGFLPLVSP
jgi:hypothetical protein